MSKVRALISISCVSSKPKWFLDHWRDVFKARLGEDRVKEVDSVAGWGCLDQNWIEVKCDIETSYSWCRPLCLDEDDWGLFFSFLQNGNLIMMVHYIENDGSLTPHH